jgi:hypothetical protein
MALTKNHEIHTRRFSRNLGVGAALVTFVALVFGLTIAKVTRDGPVQGFDHQIRPELVKEAE